MLCTHLSSIFCLVLCSVLFGLMVQHLWSMDVASLATCLQGTFVSRCENVRISISHALRCDLVCLHHVFVMQYAVHGIPAFIHVLV